MTVYEYFSSTVQMLLGFIIAVYIAKIEANGKTAQRAAFEADEAKSFSLLKPIFRNIINCEKVGELIEEANKGDTALPVACHDHYNWYYNAPEDEKDYAYWVFSDEVSEAFGYYNKNKKFGKFNLRLDFRALREARNKARLSGFIFVITGVSNFILFDYSLKWGLFILPGSLFFLFCFIISSIKLIKVLKRVKKIVNTT